MSHTPGPWMVRTRQTYDRKLVVEDKRQFIIASIHQDADEHEAVEHEEQAANARLIAQAPALREALESLLAELSDVQVEAVREGCGNTNAAVLQFRISEARALLKEIEP